MPSAGGLSGAFLRRHKTWRAGLVLRPHSEEDPVIAFFEGILEQDGLVALDPAPEDQPRELESGDLVAR